MGRYATIELLKEAEVPAGNMHLTARMSWKGHFIAALFLLGWSVALPGFLLTFGSVNFDGSVFEFLGLSVAGLFVGAIVLICFLAGLLFLFSALAALRSTNWTLRAGPEGIYLKLRNYGDFRLPPKDKVVAFIPKREIRKLGFIRRKTRRVGDKDFAMDDQLIRDEYLEIELFGADLSVITDALTMETRRHCPTLIKGVTARAKGAAVKVHPKDGVIRVDWKTRGTRLLPPLTRAEPVLASLYRTSEAEEPDEAPIKTLRYLDQESRLLEMVRRGDKIDALSLARDLYGFSLTEAHMFLKTLQG